MLSFEGVVAGVAAGGHQREQREVRETGGPFDVLGPHDPLHGGQPHRLGPARGAAADRRLQGEGVGGVGGDLAVPDGRDHLVLVDGGEGRARAEGRDRRQHDGLEAGRERRQRGVLGPPQVTETDRAGRGEAVVAVATQHVGGRERAGSAPHDLQQQRGEVRPGQPFGQDVEDLGSARLPQDAVESGSSLSHPPCLPDLRRGPRTLFRARRPGQDVASR
ncbi:hypothetical protein [Nonomuraea bangladeshensis]|uniref:hypothetical protein n=1 Tax=Nonomuraea bangladeshensis TaxID=404385 RepID=UPI003C2FC73F